MRVLHVVAQTVKWVTVDHRTHKRMSEDVMDRCEVVSLADADLEETWKEPGHGFQSVHDTIDWWSDGEDSRYESN